MGPHDGKSRALPELAPFDAAVAAIQAGALDADRAAADLVAQLSEDERLWLLDGDVPFWRGVVTMARAYNTEPIVAGAVPRVGLPGLRFCDGPRGVVMGRSTAFPAVIARAATWDVELEERIGRAIGAEARAQGANFFGGVVANIARHPGWGRTQESYGEDPVVVGAMAAALTRGVREHVMACVKHFALNSMEDRRFVVDVRVDEQTLHRTYLPQFRAAIDAGADAVGTSYNRVNGEWAGQSATLLSEVLRERWGFAGFTMTDFMWGVRDPIGSIPAGQDVEMPFRQQRARRLPAALRRGEVEWADVDRAARRIVGAQLRHAAARGPAPARDVVAGAAHRALAREAAAQGMVLLRNERVGEAALLPLAGSAAAVAVVGPLAASSNLGDAGSSAVRPPATSSVLDGLREAVGCSRVLHDDGSDVARAAALAARAETTVVVVGLRGERDEGEGIVVSDPKTLTLAGPPLNRPRLARLVGRLIGFAWPRIYPGGGDRRDLRLHQEDEELVLAIAAANPRTVVVLVGGSTILMERWRHAVPAILLAWYPGMEGGRAVADVLLGVREPGGRLPMAIPTDAAHLPPWEPDADVVVYDEWIGQRRLDRDGRPAAHPLGFGLGYTTFAIDELSVDEDSAHVTVRNTGEREGATVVQLYACADGDPATRRLVGFARVAAAAGARAAASIALDLTSLAGDDPWEVRAALHAGDARGPVAERASRAAEGTRTLDLLHGKQTL